MTPCWDISNKHATLNEFERLIYNPFRVFYYLYMIYYDLLTCKQWRCWSRWLFNFLIWFSINEYMIILRLIFCFYRRKNNYTWFMKSLDFFLKQVETFSCTITCRFLKLFLCIEHQLFVTRNFCLQKVQLLKRYSGNQTAGIHWESLIIWVSV